MSDIKLPDERRQQKRFKAAEGVFAALVDQESRLGQIKDISSHGLSFRYIDSHEKLANAKELKIILGNRGLYLDKVPFKIVSDFEIESEFSFSRVSMRQIG
ncbi:MAG: PilZ domain-containing protein, partial [Deltaproteobacteria bacterium]|nr:PilZ domain-containing protein [Deltaproteobacteria bacterium]